MLLADDHSVTREGLQSILERSEEFEVVGQARDGVEAVQAASELSPDLIVMDVMMPRKDGVEACREIMESLPETRVLMLTASTEANAVIEAVAAGAAGYLQKVAGMDQVLGMMKSAAAGEGRLPTEVVRRVFDRMRSGARVEGADQPDAEGEGDTGVVLPGHVIRCDCEGKGSQGGHRPKRHLHHSDQAGRFLEAGDRGVGRARTGCWMIDDKRATSRRLRGRCVASALF